MAEGGRTNDFTSPTELEHGMPSPSSALRSRYTGEQSRPLTPCRSMSTNEAALHQWTAWRISINEGLSHNIKVYRDDEGHNQVPNPIAGRLDAEPFKNSVKVPSFGPNLRQTYGRKSGNQIQNHPLNDDVFLMYGIPRVNLVRKNVTYDRSKSADGQ